MRIFVWFFCLAVFANPLLAGEWLDCKRKQARNPNEKIDCTQYEKPNSGSRNSTAPAASPSKEPKPVSSTAK